MIDKTSYYPHSTLKIHDLLHILVCWNPLEGGDKTYYINKFLSNKENHSKKAVRHDKLEKAGTNSTAIISMIR